MRFERLHLERYGHFTGKALDLGGDIPLHIVHGRNEAGKSTILSAISDLLFGIPARTTFNFLHDHQSLRIGASIVSRAGDRLSFRRRKGNAKTLLTESDGVLPDGALVPFLGDADRGLFESMFGLDHTRLREAGRRMIETGGDLGRSLFEAGSGLDTANSVLGELKAEIDSIGTPEHKSAKKPLWAAVNDFVAAQKAKRELTLRHEEFHAAEKALAAAIAARAKVNEELATIRERRSLLERIRRAGPILIEIDALEDKLAALADVPDLPASFEAERLRGAEALLAAETALATARSAHESLAQELEEIPASDTLTRYAEEIAALRVRLGEYLKGIADEPKLARDIARFDDEIARHVAELGLALGPAEAEDKIPRKPLVKKIRDAIFEGGKLRTRLDGAKDQVAQAEQALAAAEAELRTLDGVEDPADALSFLEASAKLGDVVSILADCRREAASAARAAEEGLQRVPGWTKGLEALAVTSFPSLETIKEHEQRQQKLDLAKDAEMRKRDEAEAEISLIAAELTTLETAGEIPSPQAVAAARDHRDLLWRHLRSSRDFESGLVGDYELSIRRADELADRKSAEAQRVARFAELTGRKEHLSQQARDARARIDAVEKDLAAAEATWRATWASIGLVAEAPATMRALLSARDDALRRLDVKRGTDERLLRARESETRARGLLGSAAKALGAGIAADIPFDELDHLVRAAAKDRQSRWKRRQDAEETARRARRALEDEHKEMAALGERMEAWTDAWSRLVKDVSCPDDAGPEEAATVLEIWDQMREPVTKRTDTLRRLEGLRADNARFRADVENLVGRISRLAEERGEALGLDLHADPRDILERLVPSLDTERLRLERRAGVGKRLEAAEVALEKSEANLAAARAAMIDLRRLHHLEDAADLAVTGQRAAEKLRLVEALRKRREDLTKAGEGYDEATLRDQSRSVTPDAAAAEVAALEGRESELVPAGQAAAQEEAHSKQVLGDLRGRAGAADAELQSRNAAFAFAGHAERWLLLETARRLMIRAVERYRDQNEHPMITRASELLTRIAAGAENPITGLAVDYRDGNDPVIVGLRKDGRRCDVAEMSEGTRDQLFLCLRIAAIELYARDREPLPFIADDLFVTSDDDRVVPGLAALVELGATTQVILFTHHRHVVAAARTLPAGAVEFDDLAALGASAAAASITS